MKKIFYEWILYSIFCACLAINIDFVATISDIYRVVDCSYKSCIIFNFIEKYFLTREISFLVFFYLTAPATGLNLIMLKLGMINTDEIINNIFIFSRKSSRSSLGVFIFTVNFLIVGGILVLFKRIDEVVNIFKKSI